MHHRSLLVLAQSILLPSALGVLALTASTREISAATRAERLRASEEYVQEALHREIYGLDGERQELLERAADETPDFAPAMWHRGYVRWQNKWVKAEEIPAKAESDARVAAYRKVRDDYPPTAAGQLELANWCAKKGLADREQAHLMAVLDHEPNHVEARTRLGFHRIDGEWVSDAEIDEAARELDATRESLAKWQSEIDAIAKLLSTKSELKRDAARQRVEKITDADAVPALEHHLAGEGQAAAELAVAAIDRIQTHEAAQALGRLAVFSPWTEIRAQAAKCLRERSQDTYVPSLLATMYTPMIAQTRVVPGRGGRLLYRHAFMREGQGERELLVLDTAYRRVSRIGGDGRETLGRMLADASDTAMRRQISVAQMNRRTEELNKRVVEALTAATNVQLPLQPQAWWDWWNDQNEIFVQGDKQLQAVRRAQQFDVVDFVPQATAAAVGAAAAASAAQEAKDCLAPGTQIMTAAGLMAVEEIRVGDLVLAQHVETGEMTYKPVIRTTLRPKTKLVTIHAGDFTIQASGGHPFWVAGEGWVKARDLASGMELHCASGTARVTAVELGGDEIETHNLIIADFNTYFVGKQHVLSHDNTIREATNAIVPGLLNQ
ncbi:MAG: polymorphic toxin-type HINT domain-containing protein [Pirellulaceae bacterium]